MRSCDPFEGPRAIGPTADLVCVAPVPNQILTMIRQVRRRLEAAWTALRRQMTFKFLLPSILLVLGAATLAGGLVVNRLGDAVRARAEAEADAQLQRIQERLHTLHEVKMETVHSGMTLLKDEASARGTPNVAGRTTLQDASVPNLRLGTASQVGRYQMVDYIASVMGGTATLFVRNGDAFVRVSTNVEGHEGQRAVGTELDPEGRAYAAIMAGEPYYGVVGILGAQYLTGYEPMYDADGAVIGVWYVGYPLEAMEALQASIEEARILEGGFVALLNSRGEPLVHGGPADRVHRTLAAEEGGWHVRRAAVEAWGYEIVAAYPRAAVAARLQSLQWGAVAFGGAFAILIVGLSYGFFRRFVVRPVQALERAADRAADGDYDATVDLDSDDEVGRLAWSFNAMLAQMKDLLADAHARQQEAKASAASAREARAQTERQQKQLQDSVDRVLAKMKGLAEGDLTVRLPSDREGTIGSLYAGFNAAVRTMQETIKQVGFAAEATAHAADDIRVTIDELGSGIQGQSSQADEVAAAMEEMSRTIVSNAETATRSAEVAATSRNQARENGEIILDMVEKVEEVGEEVMAASQMIRQLGDSTQEIGQIVVTIDEIADRTNLLALNAAIEAARAGEHGQGFAVVADEVRQLAERTAQATDEIGSMISGIQDDTERAVNTMARGQATVQSGLALIGHVRQAFGQIADGIETMSGHIETIATATEEQSVTSEQISHNVEAISQMSAKAAQRAGKATDAVATLTELAAEVRTLTHEFEVDAANSPTAPADRPPDRETMPSGPPA